MDLFFTTPIFYPNDKPHLGTAYTLILADFYKKLLSKKHNVIVSTGTDEHGKKVETAAHQRHLSPENHIIIQRKNFMILKEKLQLNYDYFIATHDKAHQNFAQAFWIKVYNNGYIYKNKYCGWYSSRDEQYFNEKDLIEGKAPTGATVEWLEEECYFFKLKSFGDSIVDFYKSNSNFIYPKWRLKELINNIIHHGLEDLCISRHKSKLSWGIPVPNDPDHVMYVWFDALTNYLSVLQINEPNNFMNYWNNSYHIIGKDILYFHGIVWPAMLMAADYPWFKKLIIHGWLTVNNEKMSKSLGNAIDPCELCMNLRPDYLKYFLLREISVGSDHNFDINLLITRINDELADKIGNLVNRIINMVIKYNNSIIPEGTIIEEYDHNDGMILQDGLKEQNILHYNVLNPNSYVQEILIQAIELNKYIEIHKPWNKNITKDGRNNVLFYCCKKLFQLGTWLEPVTPIFSKNILESLGNNSKLIGNKVNNLGILIKKIQLNDGMIIEI